jgi:hypothetical protein
MKVSVIRGSRAVEIDTWWIPGDTPGVEDEKEDDSGGA